VRTSAALFAVGVLLCIVTANVLAVTSNSKLLTITLTLRADSVRFLRVTPSTPTQWAIDCAEADGDTLPIRQPRSKGLSDYSREIEFAAPVTSSRLQLHILTPGAPADWRIEVSESLDGTYLGVTPEVSMRKESER